MLAQRQKTTNGANLGFEAQLWATADKLRSNLELSNYKHAAPGLFFLKYISDAFEAKRAELLKDDLANRSAGTSVALSTLIKSVGWSDMFGVCDTVLFDLLIENKDLPRLAETIHEQVYAIQNIETIPPFDGTLLDYPADGDADGEWLLRENILPFLDRWSANLLRDVDVEAYT